MQSSTLARRLLDTAARHRETAALLQEAAKEINALTVLALDAQARAEAAERACGVAVAPLTSEVAA